MASIGKVVLALGLDNKEFKSSLTNAEKQMANSINNMKNLFIGAQLGKYLFSGAEQQARENLKVVQTELSALAEGLSQEQINLLKPIIDQVDYLGVAADQAADVLYKFVLTGRAMGLQQMGIYLDKTTQSFLSTASAAERTEWAISNIPKMLEEVKNKIDPTTAAFYEFKKKSDDVKKALGTSFLGVITNVIDSLGGVTNAMKIGIIAFTSYKTAMILGNVGIGISKAIAQGGVFATPIALAMGATALTSISALIGGASLAVNALNNIPEFSSNNAKAEKGVFVDTPSSSNVNITIKNDRYGQFEELSEKSNGILVNSQTKFG